MTVRASASVTLSWSASIVAVTRYYQLAAPTAATPTVPTSSSALNGWSETEPTADVTKVLWTCERTVYADGTESWSKASKSTSYEAAKDAKSAANAAKNTADSAKSAADNLKTLIREDATGITVGKSADGKTWSTGRTHMDEDSFDVLDKAGNVLSSFGKNLIELGKNSTEAAIKFCGGLASIAAKTVTWHDNSTHLVTDIHSQYGTGLSCDTTGTEAGEPFKAYMGVQTATGWTDDTYGVCEMAGGTLLLTDPSITDGDATVGFPMKTLINVLETAASVPLSRFATAIQPIVLFDKWDNAFNAGCTLSETAAHFVRMLIEYKTDDGHKGSTMVTPITGATSVDGQILDLTCNVYNGNRNIMYIKSKAVQISGTTIDTYNNGGYWTGIHSTDTGNKSGDYITIVKVTGWR